MRKMKQNKLQSDRVSIHGSRKEYNTNSALSAQMKKLRRRLCLIEWLLIIRKTYSTAHYKKKENSEMEKNYSAADEREQKTHTADDRATEEEHCCDYLWAPHSHTQHTQMEQRENEYTAAGCVHYDDGRCVCAAGELHRMHTHTHTLSLSLSCTKVEDGLRAGDTHTPHHGKLQYPPLLFSFSFFFSL